MKRVLLVDDNRLVRKAVRDRLMEHLSDVTVAAAGDGREALDIIKTTGGVDMLITEVDLPGMNGYELIGQVRRQKSSMPIMVTTDDCSQKVVQLLTSLGVNRWIEKPFDGKTIAAAVRTELDQLA
jgi:DNA-binding response OmpR family regulator